MKNLNIKITNEIDELALRFATKLPKETNFNNNKTKKYFETIHNECVKNSSLSSSETVRMSYKSCRKSKYSILYSEKSKGM